MYKTNFFLSNDSLAPKANEYSRDMFLTSILAHPSFVNAAKMTLHTHVSSSDSLTAHLDNEWKDYLSFKIWLSESFGLCDPWAANRKKTASSTHCY